MNRSVHLARHHRDDTLADFDFFDFFDLDFLK